MKYAIVKIVNGTFSIDSEWKDNITGAIVKFHSVSATLWNETTVETATVEIIDNQGNVARGYKESINKIPEPEPEQ